MLTGKPTASSKTMGTMLEIMTCMPPSLEYFMTDKIMQMPNKPPKCN